MTAMVVAILNFYEKYTETTQNNRRWEAVISIVSVKRKCSKEPAYVPKIIAQVCK